MAQREEQERRSFGPAGMRRRAELMEAAVRLAARQGFARTRVSDIVGEVGVGQGVFYWYFESKDALFREILDDTTRRLRLFQAAFIAEEEDPVRRIAKGILATLEFIVHNVHAFALLDHASMQAHWRQQRGEAIRVHTLDTARHVQEAFDRDLARSADPESVAQAIAGVVDRMSRRYLGSGRKGDLDGVAQETIDFCLAGMTGARLIEVEDLRSQVTMTPELEDLRDRVGAGGTERHGS